MDAGDKDREVTFRQNTPTLNARNEQVPSWGDLKTVWAKVTDVKGTEKYEASKLADMADIRILIWYDSVLVDKTLRFKYGADEYDIYSIEEKGREHELVMFGKLIDDE